MKDYIAQTDLGEAFFGGAHPLQNMTGVAKFVGAGFSNALVVAGVVLIIIIIYSGISMLTAAGNAQMFERSRLVLTSGIIGFVIVVASWFIVNYVVYSTVGISPLL
jgi:Zn-dependent protease with chaperone function